MDWLLKSGLSKKLENLALFGFPAVIVFVFFVVLGLGHVDGVELQFEVFVGGLPARSGERPQQPGGFDDAEPLGWVGDRRSAPGHLERLIGGRGAGLSIGEDRGVERNLSGEFGENSMTFECQVATRRRGPCPQSLYDPRIKAARAEKCCLNQHLAALLLNGAIRPIRR